MYEDLPQSDFGDEVEQREKPKVYYHGSKRLLGEGETIERRKASAPEGRPAEEDADAIYLTPDFISAVAFAARPRGITDIDYDHKTMHFENPEAFDPNREIYVYEVDAASIPEDKITQIEERQISVDLDSLKPGRVIRMKAGEVTKYFKIV
jgi:hypothetical protein